MIKAIVRFHSYRPLDLKCNLTHGKIINKITISIILKQLYVI